MYFSNINDAELNQFHGKSIINMDTSLEEILTSSLFKVETIRSGILWRIYPLFYCESITSSNPDDRILDNKCIICIANQDGYQALSFKSPYDDTDIHLKYNITYVNQYPYTLPPAYTIIIYNSINQQPIQNAEVTITTDTPSTFNGVTNENGQYNWNDEDTTSQITDITVNYNGTTYTLLGGE